MQAFVASITTSHYIISIQSWKFEPLVLVTHPGLALNFQGLRNSSLEVVLFSSNDYHLCLSRLMACLFRCSQTAERLNLVVLVCSFGQGCFPDVEFSTVYVLTCRSQHTSFLW